MRGRGTGDGEKPHEIPYCKQSMGSKHGHSPHSVLSFNVCIEGHPGVIPLHPTYSSRTMPNLSQHLSTQHPASAPCTWTQSQSQTENGKKPSDSVHQQLLFIYPGSFLPRKDLVGEKALPTPSGCHSRDHAVCWGCPGEEGADVLVRAVNGPWQGWPFPAQHQGPGGSPHLCAGAGPALVSCGDGRWRNAGLQTHRYPAEAFQTSHSSLLCFLFPVPLPKKKTMQALELIKQRTESLGCAGVQL